MTITTTAHANFRGQAREALTYYQSVLGGELALATWARSTSPRLPRPPTRSRSDGSGAPTAST